MNSCNILITNKLTKNKQYRGFNKIAKKHQTRINESIVTMKVRLIDSDGSQVGILATDAALDRAKVQKLDLVEISPKAEPPVCKIMDYGKFRFENSKKKQASKKKQKRVQLKEVKFRPNTEEADYQVKLRNLRKFIGQGNKVKVTIMFRGRELAHRDIGANMLDRLVVDLEEEVVVEQRPAKMEGRFMIMLLAPIKSVKN